ncbi:MAG: TetR/AcrR family transcriptional regulator [Mucilaginibacter sp.]|uniref:TetR/AcrR family transcriptional regulator n=1 Tax=Mucilaginibacter sp. TaxID=1882438 RepID=UPI0031AF8278
MRTAARLFYQNGYSNTGINQIVEEAGIAKSSLYLHFRSKEDLLLAYLEETGTETLGLLKQVSEGYQTPKGKVLAIFDHLKLLVLNNDFNGCHFLNIVYEMPQGAVRVREQVKKQKDGVRDIFSEILRPLKKEHLADEIYTLFEGALIANKVHADSWPVISARNIAGKLI